MKIVIVRDNIIENIGSPPLNGPPPAGTTAHEFDGFVSIGWEWNGGTPVDPNPPVAPPPPPAPTVAQKLAGLGITMDELKAALAANGA